MNNNKNTYIAVILGAAGLLCCVGVVAVLALGGFLVNRVGESITMDPEKVAEIGSQMVEYEVPAGYREVMAMDLMGTRMIAIGPESGSGMALMLMQIPNSTDLSDEEMREQMEEALARQQGSSAQYNFQTVGEEEVTVRGEEVTLIVREGENSQGKEMRQVTGIFMGKTAPIMFMAMGDPNDWDQDAMDEFLASIK